MRKIALTSVFANLTYNDKNHRGLEAIFIKKMMEEKGAQVDCVGYKNRNMKDLDFYHNYTDSDFSEYGAVIVQLSTPNFFVNLFVIILQSLKEKFISLSMTRVFHLLTTQELYLRDLTYAMIQLMHGIISLKMLLICLPEKT